MAASRAGRIAPAKPPLAPLAGCLTLAISRLTAARRIRRSCRESSIASISRRRSSSILASGAIAEPNPSLALPRPALAPERTHPRSIDRGARPQKQSRASQLLHYPQPALVDSAALG